VTAKDRSIALRSVFLRRSVPYGLFALACGLSAGASWYVASTAADAAAAQAEAEFLTDAQDTRRDIQAGVNSYVEVVRAGGVLLSADNEINGVGFRRFVAGLQVRERYPGMDGIGFAQCVPRGQLGRLLRTIDLDGVAIRLWPDTDRATRCPTLFLEPSTARNKRSLGFDLGAEDELAEAMAMARDTGQPTASRKLASADVWTDGWRGNIVLLVPVYRFGAPIRTIDERRNAIFGYVFSPLNSEELLEAIVASVRLSVTFEVHDSAASAATLLSARQLRTTPSRYESAEPVLVAGRDWLVTVRSAGEAVAQTPVLARQTFIGGLLLSFMLFLITRAQVRAWETSVRHEQALRASALALRESESDAHAANRAKDEFLATLSHELRTPLNVVLGWVSMLRARGVPDDKVPHALEVIERNARQQAQLIDDLLDVSRVVTGKLRLEMRPVPLARIAASVIESLRPSADAKGIVLEAPPRSTPADALGDPDRVRQVVWNLLSNAIKFTPRGGRVSASLSRTDGHVQLSVRDTGIGIAPDFLPHVFERFRQADSSTTRTHSGLGLGLAIARHLVELHGGTLEAHSDGEGRGATFVMTLRAAPAESASAAPVAAPASDRAPRLQGLGVLVVDDDPATLDMLVQALGSAGALVVAAESARRALDLLHTHEPDVIVSDIAMPGEDGFWLIERVRALPGTRGQTPAIALTALARREDRGRALAAGYQVHMAKPVDLNELESELQRLAAIRLDGVRS
jgi:signal transduction histidine kinase